MPERKPPRMRAACGQCHSAKVKCSGEKTGCTRCQKLGLVCEYGVSMVGRASKKKNRDDNADQQDVVMADGSDEDIGAGVLGEGGKESEGLPLLETTPDAFTLPLGTDAEFNFGPQDFMSITGLNDFSFHAFPSNMFDDVCNHDHSHDHEMVSSDPFSVPDLSIGGSSTDGSSPSQQLHAQGSQAHGSHHHTPLQPLIDPFTLPAQNNRPIPPPWQDPQQQQQTPSFHTTNSSPHPSSHMNGSSNNHNHSHHHHHHHHHHNNNGVNGQSRPMPPEPLSLSLYDGPRVSAAESTEPIFCLARLAYYLERRLHHAGGSDEAQAQPLDVTLDVIRSSLRELMSLARLAGTMPSYGCRSLIFACLTLVVKLYSQSYAGYRAATRPFVPGAAAGGAAAGGSGDGSGGMAAMDKDGREDDDDDDASGGNEGDGNGDECGNGTDGVSRKQRRRKQQQHYCPPETQRPQPVPSAATATMRLGQFQVDPEDQIKLQNQIIAAELGRCVQVIKTMAREATKLCPRGGNCNGVKGYECLVSDAQAIKTNIEKESLHDKRMVHPLI